MQMYFKIFCKIYIDEILSFEFINKHYLNHEDLMFLFENVPDKETFTIFLICVSQYKNQLVKEQVNFSRNIYLFNIYNKHKYIILDHENDKYFCQIIKRDKKIAIGECLKANSLDTFIIFLNNLVNYKYICNNHHNIFHALLNSGMISLI